MSYIRETVHIMSPSAYNRLVTHLKAFQEDVLVKVEFDKDGFVIVEYNGEADKSMYSTPRDFLIELGEI